MNVLLGDHVLKVTAAFVVAVPTFIIWGTHLNRSKWNKQRKGNNDLCHSSHQHNKGKRRWHSPPRTVCLHKNTANATTTSYRAKVLHHLQTDANMKHEYYYYFISNLQHLGQFGTLFFFFLFFSLFSSSPSSVNNSLLNKDVIKHILLFEYCFFLFITDDHFKF